MTTSYPIACGNPACDLIASREHLASIRADGMAHDYACTCGWRADLCDCGKPMTWDPAARGQTCGGLDVVGALVCCGRMRLSYLSASADQAKSTWSIAKSGRSIDAGGVRIRVEGAASDTAELIRRIASLPELERELELLRRTRTA